MGSGQISIFDFEKSSPEILKIAPEKSAKIAHSRRKNSPAIAAAHDFSVLNFRTDLQKPEQKIAAQISQKLAAGEKNFLNVGFGADAILCGLRAARDFAAKNNEKIFVAFAPSERKKLKKIAALFDFKKVKFCFADARENFLCARQWQFFLQNEDFSPTQVSMALKILREKYLQKSREHIFDFIFRGAEFDIFKFKLTAKLHQNCDENCPARRAENEIKNSQIIFVPQNALENFSISNLIILNAEKFEDNFSKNFTNEVGAENIRFFFDDFLAAAPRQNLKSADRGKKYFFVGEIKNLKKGIDFGFAAIANFIEQKIETTDFAAFLEITPADENCAEFLNFKNGFRHGAQQFEKFFPDERNLLAEIEKWRDFFSVPAAANEIKFLTLFPDGGLRCTRAKVNLKKKFAQFLKNKKTALFLGKNLPQNAAGNLAISCVDENFKIEKVGANFDFEKRALFFAEKNPLSGGEKKSLENAAKIIEFLKFSRGNICAAFSSQKMANEVSEILRNLIAQNLEKNPEIFGGSISTFLHSSRASFVKTIDFWEREKTDRKILLLPFSKLHFFEKLEFSGYFLPRFVFDPPGFPLVERRKKLFRNEFFDFILPRAETHFLNFLDFATRTADGKFIFYGGDSRILHRNSWTQTFLNSLPESLPRILENFETAGKIISNFLKK